MIKVLTLVFAFVSFSLPVLQAQEVARESIIPAQSCHQDYVQRRKQLVRRAILTPVVAAAAAAAGIYATASYAEASSSWDALGVVILAALGIYATGVVTIGVETLVIAALVRANSLVKLLEESYAGSGKRLERYAKSLSRKLDRQVGVDEIANAITKADMSGILCDGSMRGRSSGAKLKKRLARKSEIKDYLYRALR